VKKNFLDASFLSFFCMELYLALQAGITISESLLMLSEDEPDKNHQNLLKALYKETDAGNSLHSAMVREKIFPDYMVNMVEIGETTGRMEEVMGSLSAYYGRQVEMSSSLRDAVFYPATLFGVLLMVILVLIIKVLPIFQDVFGQLGLQMSPLVAFLLHAGQFISSYKVFFITLVSLLIVFILWLIYDQSMRSLVFNFMQNRLTGTDMGKKMLTARFSAALSMALSSGLDFDESFRLAEKLCANQQVAVKSQRCRRLLKEGKSLYEAISAAEIFPVLYRRMIYIGMRTGSIDIIMREIAQRSEREFNDKLDEVIGDVEPALVIVASLVVGLILLAVMLPLVNIMSFLG